MGVQGARLGGADFASSKAGRLLLSDSLSPRVLLPWAGGGGGPCRLTLQIFLVSEVPPHSLLTQTFSLFINSLFFFLLSPMCPVSVGDLKDARACDTDWGHR